MIPPGESDRRDEDEALAENPKFWKMIGEAAAASRAQA